MKSKLIAILVAGFISSAHAEGTPNDALDTCNFFGQVAKMTMVYRQSGGTLDTKLRQINSNKDKPEQVKHMDRLLAISAFRVPKWDSVELQQEAIESFGNDALVECLRESGAY